jgi:hypothetical protein
MMGHDPSDDSGGTLTPRRPMNTRVVLRNIGTAVFVALFLLVAGRMHGGFIALVLLPFFIIVWLYDVVVMSRKPEERAPRAKRMTIWMLAFGVVAALNWHWYRESRAYAERVVVAVENFKSRTGAYPWHLQDAGIDAKGETKRWMLVYSLRDGKTPWIAYAAPFVMFDRYEYDFAKHEWTYLAD